MVEDNGQTVFTSRERREFFLQMAAAPKGVTVAEVYERAKERGDIATQEAYYNIARRLAHRGLLVSKSEQGEPAKFVVETQGADQWLQEEELAEIIDVDYPLLGITVWREAINQINDIPEPIWGELRERLKGISARELFFDALVSYCDDFDAQISDLVGHQDKASLEYTRLYKEAEASLKLLIRLTKYGLGLSEEAITLPVSVDVDIRDRKQGSALYVNKVLLKEELARRVEDTAFITEALPERQRQNLLVGAVDGSTRGGLLSLSGEDGDFNIAHAPLVNINTAVGQINRALDIRGRLLNLFIRLPERPEDMQRQDNRHTVMAKLLHPDLTDAQYMHAVWNAMDLVEIRATLRLLRRWMTNDMEAEVPPADVVFRDGTVTPQDRDFAHYKERDSYGQIVRDIIEACWDLALRCREEDRTVCGVVKTTQLWFYGPIINWFACQLAKRDDSQIKAWPLASMNFVPDQVLITRILTSGRTKGDQWTRTCIVLRPFHAISNYGRRYQRSLPPADEILRNHSQALENPAAYNQEDRVFWENFQGIRDPYVKMLREVHYGSFFIAAIPRLDYNNLLPRFELLVPAKTDEGGDSPWPTAERHTQRVLDAIESVGFDVAAEHNMFLSVPKLDILPRILLKAHDTVKIWAAELMGRVQEYVGYHLTRHGRARRIREVRIRPFTRPELKALYEDLRRQREQSAGTRRLR